MGYVMIMLFVVYWSGILVNTWCSFSGSFLCVLGYHHRSIGRDDLDFFARIFNFWVFHIFSSRIVSMMLGFLFRRCCGAFLLGIFPD